MAKIIKKEENLPSMESIFQKLSCGRCPIKRFCDRFKETYQILKKKNDKGLNIEAKKVYKKPISAENKAYEIDNLKEEYNKRFTKMLNDCNEECHYETQIIKETYNLFKEKIDLDMFPELSIYVEQIIKLKINDFRINNIHKRYGILQENDRGLKLVPGLHYSMETSKQIADIIEKMNKIMYGEKMQNVNVNLNLTEELINTYRKRVDQNKNI